MYAFTEAFEKLFSDCRDFICAHTLVKPARRDLFPTRYCEAIEALSWYARAVPELGNYTVYVCCRQSHVLLNDRIIDLRSPSAVSLLHEVGHVIDYHTGNKAVYRRRSRWNGHGLTPADVLATERRATRFSMRVLPLTHVELADAASCFMTYLLDHHRCSARHALRRLNNAVLTCGAGPPPSDIGEHNAYYALAGTDMRLQFSQLYDAFKDAAFDSLAEQLNRAAATAYVELLDEVMERGSITG